MEKRATEDTHFTHLSKGMLPGIGARSLFSGWHTKKMRTAKREDRGLKV